MIIDNGIGYPDDASVWTEAHRYRFEIHLREGDKDARASITVQGAMHLMKELDKFLKMERE